MEQQWARQVPRLDRSLPRIAEILKPLGLSPLSATPLTEGKANTNLLVETSGERVVLRFYQRDPAIQSTETAIIRRAAGQVPVANVLLEDRDAQCSVLEWIAGETIQAMVASGRADQIDGRSIGLALGKIGQNRFPHSGFLDSDLQIRLRFDSAVSGLIDYARSNLTSPNLSQRTDESWPDRAAAFLQEWRPRWEEAAGPPCLVHADFKAANLLVQDGQLAAVLDWEFAYSGTWLSDLGQILRIESHMPPGFAEDILAGVAETGQEVPADTAQLARALDVINSIEFLSRPSVSESQVHDLDLRLLPFGLGLHRETT